MYLSLSLSTIFGNLYFQEDNATQAGEESDDSVDELLDKDCDSQSQTQTSDHSRSHGITSCATTVGKVYDDHQGEKKDQVMIEEEQEEEDDDNDEAKKMKDVTANTEERDGTKNRDEQTENVERQEIPRETDSNALENNENVTDELENNEDVVMGAEKPQNQEDAEARTLVKSGEERHSSKKQAVVDRVSLSVDNDCDGDGDDDGGPSLAGLTPTSQEGGLMPAGASQGASFGASLFPPPDNDNDHHGLEPGSPSSVESASFGLSFGGTKDTSHPKGFCFFCLFFLI